MCCRRWPSPRRWWRAGTSRRIHYVGADAGDRDPAAADDAVSAHASRRRRVPAPAVAAQPRLRAEAAAGDAARAAGCSAGCDRRWSCRSAGTPACPPCSPPSDCASRSWSCQLRPPPGRASALAARFAAACAVAFHGSPLPRAEVTGAPVRRSVRARRPAAERDAARARARHPGRSFPRRGHRRFAGFGRAQRGDHRASSTDHADDATSPIRHVVGERFRDAASPPRREPTASCTSVFGYEDQMDARLRRRRPVGRPRRRQHGRRARGHRHAGDPRAVGRIRRGPPDRRTCAGCPTSAAAVLLPEADARRLGAEIDDLRGDTGRPAGDGGRGHGARRRAPQRRIASADRACCRLEARELADRLRVADPLPPLDLSSPERLHVVGVGGPGMSADRPRARRDGPRRVRAATCASRRCSIASARRRRHRARRPRPGARRGLRRRHRVDRRSRPTTSSSTTRPATGIPTLRRAGMLASICAHGPIGRRGRHARQDHDDVDAHAGARRGRVAAELRRRWRRHRRGHRRPVDRRRMAGGRGRRERRHAPRAAAARHDPDQRRGRPPRPLRHRSTRSSPASTTTSRRSPGRRCCASDDPRVRRAGAARTARSRTGSARAPTTAPSTSRRRPGRSASTSSTTATRLGHVDLPLRGMHNVRNAFGVVAMATELGVPFDAARRGARPLRRRRPPVRHPRHRRRRHVRRRLRPPPTEIAAVLAAARGERRRVEARRSRCSSRTASTGCP